MALRGSIERGVYGACPERRLIVAIIQQALQDARRDPAAADWLDEVGVQWCVVFLGFDECRAAAWRTVDLRLRPPPDLAAQRAATRERGRRYEERKRAARLAASAM